MGKKLFAFVQEDIYPPYEYSYQGGQYRREETATDTDVDKADTQKPQRLSNKTARARAADAMRQKG